MCGRYVVDDDGALIAKHFNLKRIPKHLRPRFNAAPTQQLPVILSDKPQELSMLKWGMTPVWWSIKGRELINIREDNLKEKPTFKKLLATQRCLVVSSGYYEWKKEGARKQPYLFQLKSHQLFAYPGIWEQEKQKDGSTQLAFALIICDPNPLAAKVHDRMPVILKSKDENLWLNPNTPRETLLKLLKPYSAKLMEAQPVSTLVNSPANDDPMLIQKMK